MLGNFTLEVVSVLIHLFLFLQNHINYGHLLMHMARSMPGGHCPSTKIKWKYVYVRGLKFAVKNLQAQACQASPLDFFEYPVDGYAQKLIPVQHWLLHGTFILSERKASREGLPELRRKNTKSTKLETKK